MQISRVRLGAAARLLLLLALFLLLALPVLDAGVQLYDRDTGRCEYAFKRFIAARLAAGALPLWAPYTEAGVSLLGQITPALFHPLTLLYAALPFGLAFKLNHLLALPLAALGAFLLARRLGASPWAATTAAAVYGASGWIVSMAASNLHYALGGAALPLALAGLHAFLETPVAPRLCWAAGAAALTFLGGEPQSLFFAALLGGAGALLQAVSRSPRLSATLRAARLLALWGACTLALAGPALLPALAQLQRTRRAGAVTAHERRASAVPPARLAGLALPWAFDEQLEQLDPTQGRSPYSEYFADPPFTWTPFSTSICLGVPALLLALASLRRRTGRLLCAGGLLCALAALGPALPVDGLLRALLPGLSLFRYAEKMIAPATLLFALAAALGADAALSGSGAGSSADAGGGSSADADGGDSVDARGGDAAAAQRLARSSLSTGAVLLAARLGLALLHAPLHALLLAQGRDHGAAAPGLFLDSLGGALLLEGTLALLVGVLALSRRLRPAVPALPLAAATCAFAALLASGGLLFTAPVELLEGPFPLARALEARAGPSAGRWRVDSDPGAALSLGGLSWREGLPTWMARALVTQFNAQAGIDSVAVYSSIEDRDYLAAWQAAPRALTSLLGVRFTMRSPLHGEEAQLQALGYEHLPSEMWIREEPAQPRAFLLDCAVAAPDAEAAAKLLAAPDFDVHRLAVLRAPLQLPCAKGARALEVALSRPAPERLEAEVAAAQPALFVVAEHFDPGWRATVDGAEVATLQADLTALSVPVPAGRHHVALRFWPRALSEGLAVSAAALLLLAGFAARESLRRRARARGERDAAAA